jgi:hypothetical protein
MLEKLALAAMNAVRARIGVSPITVADPKYRDEYVNQIKAVLEALRDEMSDKMFDAGQHANSEWLNDNAPIGEAVYRAPAKAVFTAMINAALE